MSRLPSFLLVAIMVAGFTLAGSRHRSILDQRNEITPGDLDVMDNAPPLVAFTTVALGGFRGILADALWLRATRMQEEGRFFELVQLSDWITKLEPRFGLVWGFHAWNMAYNISVMLDDPYDRWRWVRHGVELIRDRGLHYSPSNHRLYWELGWMFQHKIGMDLDQAHIVYKTEWAREMGDLLGGRAPDYEALAEVSVDRDWLMAQPGMTELVKAFRDAGLDPYDAEAVLQAPADSEAGRLLSRHPAGETLRLHLRRVRIEKDYKLELDTMREIEEAYGPLDWRMPQAHSLYWGYRGQEFADDFNLVQLERMVVQSLVAAFKQGACFYDVDGQLIPSPNVDLIPYVMKAYEAVTADMPDQTSFQTADKNFLEDAIVTLFLHRREKGARELWEKLRARYPAEVKQGSFEAWLGAAFFELRLETYSYENIHGMILGLTTQAFVWYGLGDEERYVGFDSLAALCWKEYMSRLQGQQKERVSLPPMQVFRERGRKQAVEVLRQSRGRERLDELPDGLTNPEA